MLHVVFNTRSSSEGKLWTSVAKSYANCYLVLHSYLGLLGLNRELGEADVRVVVNTRVTKAK